MKDRIKQIMENENLSPAKFADRLEINRAVISHILNGRNNPSLDVVTKILSEMDYINPEWLLNGKGSMYKEGIDVDSLPKERDLFNQDKINMSGESKNMENSKEIEVKQHPKTEQDSGSKSIGIINNPVKKINQIIIYYDDSTFETFIPR